MRNRVLTGAACVALAALLAACGTTTATTTTISGSTLRIYTSLPLSGPESAVAQDVLDAEQLALQQAGGKVGRFTIVVQKLNGATSAGWSRKLLAANARTVIQRKDSIAYIGEIDPNASAHSIPITNADQLLQVSPYDTAIGLTEATPAVSGSPDTFYEALRNYGRTFGRVVPNDTFQAKAQLQIMQSLGVKKLFIVEDGAAYGDAIAVSVEQQASKYGITPLVPVGPAAGLTQKIAASGADGMFYGGVASAAADQLFNGAIGADPHLKLFGPGGLDTSSFAGQLTPTAQRATYLSEPGLTTQELPPAGKAFLTAFKAAYGHVPATQAIFGFAAMQAVLSALHRAAAANNRAEVVGAFFTTTKADTANSVLGPYTINKNGDTSLAPYLFSRVKSGNLIPFQALIVP